MRRPSQEVRSDNPHQVLAGADPALARVIQRVGRCPLVDAAPCPPEALFGELCRAVISQQLSTRVASVLTARLEARSGGRLPEARALASTDPLELRALGLSLAKAQTLVELGRRCLDGELSLAALAAASDDEVIERLVEVRGIGPWTAQMVLLFALGRPDVLATADLGLKQGLKRLYELPALPTPQEMTVLTAHLRPYRSYASWYLWRVSEGR